VVRDESSFASIDPSSLAVERCGEHGAARFLRSISHQDFDPRLNTEPTCAFDSVGIRWYARAPGLAWLTEVNGLSTIGAIGSRRGLFRRQAIMAVLAPKRCFV